MRKSGLLMLLFLKLSQFTAASSLSDQLIFEAVGFAKSGNFAYFYSQQIDDNYSDAGFVIVDLIDDVILFVFEERFANNQEEALAKFKQQYSQNYSEAITLYEIIKNNQLVINKASFKSQGKSYVVSGSWAENRLKILLKQANKIKIVGSYDIMAQGKLDFFVIESPYEPRIAILTLQKSGENFFISGASLLIGFQ